MYLGIGRFPGATLICVSLQQGGHDGKGVARQPFPCKNAEQSLLQHRDLQGNESSQSNCASRCSQVMVTHSIHQLSFFKIVLHTHQDANHRAARQACITRAGQANMSMS